ncbi:MAG: NADH-quinone oxidoreductase subunit J [Anaerolineales bacterium]|jgi:NADH-quinone oxidoreductase subunit J
MDVDLLLFIGIGLVAVLSAISMLASRNAIYSALFLVINFITVATLFLLMNAAFIAMVQVTVYAGAIMVLFLFVIMLLGAERLKPTGSLPWQLPVAILLGVALIAEVVFALFHGASNTAQGLSGNVAQGFGSPTSIGLILFDQYLVPFEITSILLLVGMIGAVVITRDRGKESR